MRSGRSYVTWSALRQPLFVTWRMAYVMQACIMQATMCDADWQERLFDKTVCRVLCRVSQADCLLLCGKRISSCRLALNHTSWFLSCTRRYCGQRFFPFFEQRIYDHAGSRAWQPLPCKVFVTGCSLVSTRSLTWHHALSVVSLHRLYLQCLAMVTEKWLHANITLVKQGVLKLSCNTVSLGVSNRLKIELFYHALVLLMDVQCWNHAACHAESRWMMWKVLDHE